MASRASNRKRDAPERDGTKQSVSKPSLDPRFANLTTDPRYRPPSRKNTHVNIDKRFAHMLRDDDFSAKASVDRYGRRIPKGRGREKLERMYRVQESDEEGEDDDREADPDDEVRKELARVERKYDPARQGGFSESSSSESEDGDSSSSSEDEGERDAAVEAGLEPDTGGQQGGEEVPMGEVSSRIAVVNLDWDNMRAIDLLAVASSFCPPDGRITDVSIYPSEFGKERMQREELEGPPKELFTSKKSKVKDTTDDIEDDDISSNESQLEDDGDDDEAIQKSLLAHATAPEPEIDSRALRTYQLSRLRYFYAVITCSSPSTAQALYTDMDGREYLSTANFFDLRFVPDDVSFDDKPRDSCQQLPEGYRPQEFVTEALRHSKVRLTWDEEDQGRKELQKRAFSKQGNGKTKDRAAEIDENDLKAYVGSDSESSQASGEDLDGGVGVKSTTDAGNSDDVKLSKADKARRKMREALGLPIDDENNKGRMISSKRSKPSSSSTPAGDMQITFSAGLTADKPKSKPTPSSTLKNNPPDDTSNAKDVPEETTREKYLRKERERKERRKAKRLLQSQGSPDLEASEDAEGGHDATSFATSKEPEAETNDGKEDPFDDPFFTDPVTANAAARKEAKKAKRSATAAEATALAEKKARERAQLELLMDDGEDGLNGGGFDMAAIRKAEKEAAKKGKKAKGRKKENADKTKDVVTAGREGDDFELDVEDPRFKGVFENHEFAIDPSNPRFSGTKGMKKLLEEGRRKRRAKRGAEEDDGDGGRGSRRTEKQEVDGFGGGGDVDELLKKIKRRKAG